MHSVTRSKQTEDLYNDGKQVMNNCTEALSTSNEYKCILITTQDIKKLSKHWIFL